MDPLADAGTEPSNGLTMVKQLSVSQKADPLSNPDFVIKQIDTKWSSQINRKNIDITEIDTSLGREESKRSEDTNHENEKTSDGTDWVVAIAVVSFDIDEGQVIEHIVPQKALSRGEQKLLSLLSFPDSNSFNAEGSMKYIFRLKRDSQDREYDYGFTYFKQRKDANNMRGYFQKSLLILTSLPYIQFFKSLVELVGNAYFNQDTQNCNLRFVESIYDSICNWPVPMPGCQYELKVLDELLMISIPKEKSNKKRINGKFGIELKVANNDQYNKSNSNNTNQANFNLDSPTFKSEPNLPYILSDLGIQERGLFQDINLFSIFKFDKINLLYKLWELVMTNQPLLVISDAPSDCSETVFGLISLISPLDFNGDYKPYFTIYDPAYRVYQEQYERKVISNAILGVTNPLFLKTFKSFPNILHLEREYETANSKQKAINYLVSTNKFYSIPDKNLSQTLLKTTSEEGGAINNSIIRKAFRSLTEAFLNTFDDYFIMQGNDIKKFDEKSFIKFLENRKFSFQQFFISHAKIVKLYAKFLLSANFIPFMKKFENVYFVKTIYK